MTENSYNLCFWNLLLEPLTHAMANQEGGPGKATLSGSSKSKGLISQLHRKHKENS